MDYFGIKKSCSLIKIDNLINYVNNINKNLLKIDINSNYLIIEYMMFGSWNVFGLFEFDNSIENNFKYRYKNPSIWFRVNYYEKNNLNLKKYRNDIFICYMNYDFSDCTYKFHRLVKPAIIGFDCKGNKISESFRINNICHNRCGPAVRKIIINANNSKIWSNSFYHNGNAISLERFCELNENI
jgi:hypothetical protein